MIPLTTSHGPTRNIRIFCHDLAHSVPGIVRISRGKSRVTEVEEKALENNTDKVIIVALLVYVSVIGLQKTFSNARVKPVRLLAVVLLSEKYDQTSKIVRSLSDFLIVPMLPAEEAPMNCQAAIPIYFGSTQHIRIMFFFCRKKIDSGPRITVSCVLWEI